MAVATQTIMDGPRNAVLKFTNDNGDAETNVLKVDISTLSGSPDDVRIDRIEYATEGMGVDILWDATANVFAWHVPPDDGGAHDFRSIGGLNNNSGAGKTGDILFTTTDETAGDKYTIILYLKKKKAS